MTIEELQRENELLRVKNKDLLMRLNTVKMLLNRVSPVCSRKLQELPECAEGCDGNPADN